MIPLKNLTYVERRTSTLLWDILRDFTKTVEISTVLENRLNTEVKLPYSFKRRKIFISNSSLI